MRKLITVAVARWRVVAWIAGMLAVSVAVGWLMYEVQKTKDQVDAFTQALADEQQAAEDRGDEPVAPEPSELLDDPTYDGPTATAAPSDEQVREAIADYFDKHPIRDGEDASPEDIAAAVAEYIVANPPKRGEQGPPPSAEQVAAAVADYLEANPPPSGPSGEKGEPGRAPTAEEIAAAVEAYIAEHPIKWCPDGTEPQEHEVLTTSGGPVAAVLCVKT